jgi:hypothetical protein
MKIRRVGAELIQTDKWTDMMKLRVFGASREYAMAPKNR